MSADNLKEWSELDERARRVRAVAQDSAAKETLQEGDLQHTLCINHGELVLQVEHGRSTEYIYPKPADHEGAEFVARIIHHERDFEHVNERSAADIERRVLDDWSILAHTEAGIDRPEQAIGG